ncbi:WPP domain-interacting tail-anchored protein 1-like isoform X1 [Lycium barbarum]|uniref:WPP domain-interacting tail-anchored protein 1-like isoform X1 n=1 Tax=Lycium barbarum TaxID=112863 RepID=UPI00293F32E5|nr:WPP domain-interacting tail-anchored protein 1-like isoform X1 [Lycium barbarum]XP_060195989.1 WPP domain-interacting tail-anchored protein 1-like isoform X1 [Lycium barbarum]XP_060195990.1 WPP domain-interacting tail-anchored protein 1-like isoform X1 [Lycium barbarum]XP_060195991.1 WPP domain-interacting tail-anchored protein 1-like isoform X1 [Lycium barbarum]
MDADTENNASASIEGVNANEVEAESNTIDSLEVLSSSGNVTQEIQSVGEILTRLELDLACFSEKLVNLDQLVMHVETRESDFEAFASEKEHTSNDIVEKAIEFDLLSGVLDSEVRELGGLLSTVAVEIENVRKVISSHGHVDDEAFILIEEKLHDSEKSLKQSQDNLLELKMQCTNFHGIILTSQGDQNWQDGEAADYFNSDALLTPKTKIKMQTVEQQRHILRMLEKSLARELDLEKKLTESRQVEEELEVRLQQEAFCMEEEIEDAWQRLFEGENAAEVLLGISKALLDRLQMAHFNLNGTVQRESCLQSKLQEMEEHLKAKENLLGKSESSSKELGDKVKTLEKRLEDSKLQLSNYTKKSQELESEIHEMEDTIHTLKEKNSEAERRIDTAENECKILKEENVELDKELNLLKSSSSERINLLEKQLRDSELRLQHAVASAEASQEKQIMLNSTIKDMEDLIEDLKLKVSKAESLMEGAEEKCIILSESNSDLNEELTFVRGRLVCLEASLRQAEETKKATARDINFRSKLITDLILQLALERERLEKQIALLIMENKAQKKLFQQNDEVPSLSPQSDGKDTRESVLAKAEFSAVTSPNECKEEKSKFTSITKEENGSGDFLMSESKEETTDSSTRLDASRNIDARQLDLKVVLISVFLFLIAVLASVLLQYHWSQRFGE